MNSEFPFMFCAREVFAKGKIHRFDEWRVEVKPMKVHREAKKRGHDHGGEISKQKRSRNEVRESGGEFLRRGTIVKFGRNPTNDECFAFIHSSPFPRDIFLSEKNILGFGDLCEGDAVEFAYESAPDQQHPCGKKYFAHSVQRVPPQQSQTPQSSSLLPSTKHSLSPENLSPPRGRAPSAEAGTSRNSGWGSRLASLQDIQTQKRFSSLQRAGQSIDRASHENEQVHDGIPARAPAMTTVVRPKITTCLWEHEQQCLQKQHDLYIQLWEVEGRKWTENDLIPEFRELQYANYPGSDFSKFDQSFPVYEPSASHLPAEMRFPDRSVDLARKYLSGQMELFANARGVYFSKNGFNPRNYDAAHEDVENYTHMTFRGGKDPYSSTGKHIFPDHEISQLQCFQFASNQHKKGAPTTWNEKASECCPFTMDLDGLCSEEDQDSVFFCEFGVVGVCLGVGGRTSAAP